MKLFRDEGGQTLVFTALLMCCLMGFMALAIDIGVAYRTQRRLQTQADAAAIAAALCGTEGVQFCKQFGGTDVSSVAQGAATANGMPSSATLTGPRTPSYGQHKNTGYYEVIITQPSPAIFMATFGGMFNGGNANNPLTIGARAVAGKVPGQTCLYVLNPSNGGALTVKGGGGNSKAPATIYAPDCSIQVNSDAGDALCSTGSKANIISQNIMVVGGQNKQGKCNGVQSNVQTGVGQVQDPYTGIKDPSNGCGAGNTFGLATQYPKSNIGANPTLSFDSGTGVFTITGTVAGKATTITTGTVASGGTGVGETAYTPVSGGPSVNEICFSDAGLTLTSPTLGGVGSSTDNEMFVFQNGFTIGGNSMATINGTVDIAGGSFNESNVNLLINGPTGDATSQPYTSLAFMVLEPTQVNGCGSSVNSIGKVPTGDGCVQLQFGSGTSTTSPTKTCSPSLAQPGIVGTVYAPKDVLWFQDSGGCLSVTNIIADELWDNSAIDIYNYNLANTTSPLDVVRLVE
jgi:hypothetical protein